MIDIDVADALMMLVWLGVNTAMGVGAFRAAGSLFPRGPDSVQALAGLTIFLSLIWASTIGLGAVGLLNRWGLMVVGGTLGAVLIWLNGSRASHARSPLPSGGTPAHRLSTDGTSAHRRRTSQIRGSSLYVTAGWVLMAGFALAHVTWRGLLGYPDEFDSLMYHLPIVVEWLQGGSLYIPESSYWWTPGNGEILILWVVAPFSGDFLFSLANVPFVLLWAIGSYRLTRELKLPPVWAHMFSMAAMLTFTTLDELDDSQNDIAIAALFISGAAFGLQYLRCRTTPSLLMMSLCVGALGGVKYNALGYAVLVVATVMGACVLGKRYRDCFGCAAFSSAAIILLSGYWYARNWIVSGSPIYPMGIGEDLASGYPDIAATTLWGNGNANVPRLAFEALWRMTGPIHYYSFWVLPSALVVLGVWAAMRGGCRERDRILYVGSLFAGTFVLLLISPFCVEDEPGSLNHLIWAYTPARYGLSWLTMIVLAMGVVVHRIERVLFHRSAERSVLAIRRVVGKITGKSSPFAPRKHATFAERKATNHVPKILSLLIAVQAMMVILVYNRERPGAFSNEFTFLFFDLTVAIYIVRSSFKHLNLRVLRAISVVIALAISLAVGMRSVAWHEGFGKNFNYQFSTKLFTKDASTSPVWDDRVMVLALRVYPFYGSRRQTVVYRPRSIVSPEKIAEVMDEKQFEYVATHREFDRTYYLYTSTYRWLVEARDQFRSIPTEGFFSLFARSPESSKALTTSAIDEVSE